MSDKLSVCRFLLFTRGESKQRRRQTEKFVGQQGESPKSNPVFLTRIQRHAHDSIAGAHKPDLSSILIHKDNRLSARQSQPLFPGFFYAQPRACRFSISSTQINLNRAASTQAAD
jgi:hypothetical protein